MLDEELPAAKLDEAVTLSEFTVSEKTDDSYVASESITGTRVRTPIKDLTFTVNVITSEFLQDFAYFEINDLGYTSSVNNFDNGGGNVNIRGYGATSYLRNGFLRLGLVDRVNVDRIEVIKGPAAAIYGMTTPAGMVNIITKRPKDRPSQSFSLATGSYQTITTETVTVNVSPVSTTPLPHNVQHHQVRRKCLRATRARDAGLEKIHHEISLEK